MLLQDKYKELIAAAKSAGIANLEVREQNNVLYINGKAPSATVKKQLWDIYNKIDPDYRAGDLVMNIQSDQAEQEYEVKSGDNLTKIGKHYGVSWQEIYEANKNIIKDPDMIQPGWKLKSPSPQ